MKRSIAIILAAALLAGVLCGCGSVGSAGSTSDAYGVAYKEAAYAPAYEESIYDGEYYYDEYYYDEYDGATAAYAAAPLSADMPAPEPEADDAAEPVQKIIYTASIDMESTEFDQAVADLAALTSSCGGYYESSSVNASGIRRSASYTIRVPAENYRAFMDAAGGLCHALNIREYTEDVSESYYDTAGRLETQRTKLARLQELLREAKDMQDIIVIESAISETEETIDRLSGVLRRYDAKVDYSTVTVYLSEVLVYQEEPPVTYGSRLSAAFRSGLQSFVDGLGDILIALAYSWLWLVLIAVVAVVVILLVRRYRARHPRPARTVTPPPVWSAPDVKADETKPDVTEEA